MPVGLLTHLTHSQRSSRSWTAALAVQLPRELHKVSYSLRLMASASTESLAYRSFQVDYDSKPHVIPARLRSVAGIQLPGWHSVFRRDLDAR